MIRCLIDLYHELVTGFSTADCKASFVRYLDALCSSCMYLSLALLIFLWITKLARIVSEVKKWIRCAFVMIHYSV